jgi:ubiquinone/menaquinone biosynthesis C-methylase UbiE
MTDDHFNQSLPTSVPENYQRFFVPVIGRPLAEDLLKEAGLESGQRVLDVGCGTGVVTRLAAEKVGREGQVVGLDINPGMLAVAKAVTPPVLAIEWHEAGADALPLADGSFDVVLCQLSLQFMPDQSAALSEMYRVLAADGRLVLNVPGPAGPLFETLAKAMSHHVAPEAANFVRAVFSLHEESEVESLVEGVGFRDVDVHAYTRELLLPDAKDFLWRYVGSTPLAGVVANTSKEARSALEAEVLGDWAKYEDERGLSYHQRIVVASAHR